MHCKQKYQSNKRVMLSFNTNEINTGEKNPNEDLSSRQISEV